MRCDPPLKVKEAISLFLLGAMICDPACMYRLEADPLNIAVAPALDNSKEEFSVSHSDDWTIMAVWL